MLSQSVQFNKSKQLSPKRQSNTKFINMLPKSNLDQILIEQESQNPEYIPDEQYLKLQSLLQSKESSLRQYAKHEHQLKMCIEEIENQNTQLSKNNQEIIKQYQSQVTNIKRQNEQLRNRVNKLQKQNQEIRQKYNQLKAKLTNNLTKRIDQNIKIYESQDLLEISKNLNRQTNKQSYKILPINFLKPASERQNKLRSSVQLSNGKEQIIKPKSTAHRYNDRSSNGSKLKVTMKDSSYSQSKQIDKYKKQGFKQYSDKLNNIFAVSSNRITGSNNDFQLFSNELSKKYKDPKQIPLQNHNKSRSSINDIIQLKKGPALSLLKQHSQQNQQFSDLKTQKTPVKKTINQQNSYDHRPQHELIKLGHYSTRLN